MPPWRTVRSSRSPPAAQAGRPRTRETIARNLRRTGPVCYHGWRMWKSAVSKLVDDVVIGVNCVLRPERALRASGPGAPPTLAQLEPELAARPPEIRWPARLDRRVGRIRIRMPSIDFDTFADFQPARDPPADTLFSYHH